MPIMKPLKNLIEALKESSADEAEAIVRQLTAEGAAALPALRAALSADEDADLRWWVVRVLAEIEHPAVPLLLQEALEDPDLSVRQCAALALRHQPNQRAIPALRRAMHAGDRLLARLAADALLASGDRAVSVLSAILAGKDPIARLEAIRALARMDDLQAVPALFAALDDESPLIEHWADIGLERRGVGMTFFYP